MSHKSIIERLTQKRDELQAALDLLRNALLGQGYVVVSDSGIAISYRINPETKQASAPFQAGGAHLAMRFTQADAETLAAATTDGNSQPAKAVHVTRAIRNEIDGMNVAISILQGE